MKNLIEIASIVTKKKISKIEIFDENAMKHRNSKFNEFYEALTTDRFKNDRDAAAALYDCGPQDARYRQLKSRFRRRLLNTLFFLDVNKPSASNYDRAHFTCNKDWSLIKILQENDAHFSAESQARSLLTTAIKYHVTEIVINLARILRAYAAKANQDKEFEEYDNLLKKYFEIQEAELRSEELYQRSLMAYHQHSAVDDEQMQSYCHTLLSLSEQINSPIVNYNMYLVWAMRYEMSREYDALLDICEQAIMYVEENPDYYQEEKIIAFYTKRMSAFLHQGDYKQGQVNAEKCLQLFPEGSETWYSFMEYYLQIALHTEHYIHGLAIFNRAVSNPSFRKLDAESREKWILYEGFLGFILEAQGLGSKVVSIGLQRMGRSRSSMLSSSIRDQRILVVLSLVLQTVKFVSSKQYHKADEEIEKLKNMANRQLSKEEYWRPIQFIRLLHQLKKANYQPAELSGTEKYMERLHSQPFTYRGALSQLEVIPYDILWRHLLDRLG